MKKGRAAMKITTVPARPTWVHLRQRARHYRFAAAMADVPRDVKMFLELATMFDLLSEQFARAEARLQQVTA
jgi:hypothetical protein